MTQPARPEERFELAAQLLPQGLRRRALSALTADRQLAEEMRLRVGRPLSLVTPAGEVSLGGEAVTRRDLQMLVEIATGASVHSAAGQMARGYISCRGGCRVGLCGSVTVTPAGPAGFAAYSSAAIRIAREHRGIADKLAPRLIRGGVPGSTLILAPPGGGKTTLLRELVRVLASPGRSWPGFRVSLCDERGEVAAMREGVPELDVGEMTDVLDSCPKAAAVMMVLRSMGPQIIALDEITAPEDAAAIETARNCGVSLIATAHAAGVGDLERRPVYRELLESGVFRYFITIRRGPEGRRYELREAGGGL